jgi:phosphoribosylaminoimidazole-succinocarboxamide synthase
MRELELPGVKKLSSGKVREMFEVGDKILMVATDRISAFDVILPSFVPSKGKILNQISEFWFSKTGHIVKNHLISTDVADFPEELQPHSEALVGRSALVRRCQPLAIECVVRGFLAGSGWKDYQRSGSVCGVDLPKGLIESDQLAEPIFTPATKSVDGHDENIPFEQAKEIVGPEVAEKAKNLSLEIYSWARDYAKQRGIIICDTKFEFGLDGDELYLIDEVLTPDSSRFWPADQYQPGKSQPSFDKQFIRDYLETLDWDKTYPGPELPDNIVEATSERYIEVFRVLTGFEPVL